MKGSPFSLIYGGSQKSCHDTHQGASKDVDGIMDTNIYLCINDKKCPHKGQKNPFACIRIERYTGKSGKAKAKPVCNRNRTEHERG